MGQHVQCFIRSRLERLRLPPGLSPVERWRVALGRVRCKLGQCIKQLRNTRTRLGRHKQNGDQVTGAQRSLKWRVQFLRTGVHAIFEVAGHQAVIFFNDLVYEGTVRSGNRCEIALAIGMAQQFDNILCVMRGQVQQQALLPETLTNGAHQRGQVHVVRIDLVDDHHAAQTAIASQIEHALRRQLDTGLRVDHDQCRIHARQRGNCLASKVGVAWCVDQMDLRAGPLHAHQCSLQGVAKLLFHGVKVTRGVALFDGATVGNGTSCRQQALGQRGLASGSMANQGDGTNVGARGLGHDKLSLVF